MSVSLVNSTPVGEQALLQGVEVLDDAVVDEGELAVLATAVRVGVLVGRAAVRGPAGVADAGRRRRQRVRLELGREVGELARLLAGLDVVAVEQGDPGGVVAAVLEPGQALHDDVERRAVVASGRRIPRFRTWGPA